jgi:hypothetical protein
MKRIAIVAAGAAAIGLAACSHSSAPSATPIGPRTGGAIAPVSCRHQYRTWAHGEGKGLMKALQAVTTASSPRHAHAARQAVRDSKRAVARAARHPIPACADPRGYWDVLLMHVDAAVAGKGSTSSVRAAMQDVAKIRRQLQREVNQTVQ